MRALRRAAIPVAAAALALGAPGCIGDDDETDATQPSISVPDTVESVPTDTTTAPGSPTTTTNPSGGATSPTQPDSPANDVPPEPGSPQERFERFCDENPAACG